MGASGKKVLVVEMFSPLRGPGHDLSELKGRLRAAGCEVFEEKYDFSRNGNFLAEVAESAKNHRVDVVLVDIEPVMFARNLRRALAAEGTPVLFVVERQDQIGKALAIRRWEDRRLARRGDGRGLVGNRKAVNSEDWAVLAELLRRPWAWAANGQTGFLTKAASSDEIVAALSEDDRH